MITIVMIKDYKQHVIIIIITIWVCNKYIMYIGMCVYVSVCMCVWARRILYEMSKPIEKYLCMCNVCMDK